MAYSLKEINEAVRRDPKRNEGIGCLSAGKCICRRL